MARVLAIALLAEIMGYGAKHCTHVKSLMPESRFKTISLKRALKPSLAIRLMDKHLKLKPEIQSMLHGYKK
jgi:hypothetical protein